MNPGFFLNKIFLSQVTETHKIFLRHLIIIKANILIKQCNQSFFSQLLVPDNQIQNVVKRTALDKKLFGDIGT